jgi:uncharacterized membrane protein
MRSKIKLAEKRSFGQKVADIVASGVGSWGFIIIQSGLLITWIIVNSTNVLGFSWDEPPFILLNLILSFQAAFTAPIIMMSQNRQSERDRRRAEADYEVNTLAEKEIELVLNRLNLMEEKLLKHLLNTKDIDSAISDLEEMEKILKIKD